jgi:hypothetical protein
MHGRPRAMASSSSPVRGPWRRATSNTGRGGLARVLAGFCLGDGVLWVGCGELTLVGVVQREERQRGGFRAVLPLLLHVLRSGSGQRGLGSIEGDSTSMATGPGTNENSDAHSERFFSDFCSPRVRSNARKNLNFKFLKTATVVCQHIGQGFKGYFCYKER